MPAWTPKNDRSSAGWRPASSARSAGSRSGASTAARTDSSTTGTGVAPEVLAGAETVEAGAGGAAGGEGAGVALLQAERVVRMTKNSKERGMRSYLEHW